MREYSEDDVRIRPGRRSRPRSKERPDHADARLGRVTAVDRGRLTVDLIDSETPVIAVRARELGRRSVVVGDSVRLVGDLSGAPGSLARIVGLEPRSTALRRTADDTDAVERVVVANADTMGIVVAAAEPQPREGFIDRCLVAAYDSGMTPLLIVTKTDLAPVATLSQAYRPLGLEVIGVSRDAAVADIRRRLADHVTVLIGQSGVGKSTLVNRLVPEADRDTGVVNEVTGRGRHTSTSAVGLRLPGGGWIIDTPGIRSFGLGHVDPERVLAAFGELAEGETGCPRGCDHEPPHCGLDDWVEHGHAGPDGVARLASVRRMLHSLTG